MHVQSFAGTAGARIVGVEVNGMWMPDEDGSLRRAGRLQEWCESEPGAGLVAHSMSESDWDAWNWHCELMRRLDAHACSAFVDREAAQAAADREARARMESVEAEASGAVGLVSVLSSDTPTFERRRKLQPTASFALKANQQAAVQAAGAFVAGGDESRMAKLRRAVGFTARVHGAARKGHRPDEVRMITCTYREGEKWEALHITKLIKNLRAWHERRGLKFRYVWVAELQDGKRRADGVGRGVVHYHLAAWVPVGTEHFPMSDKQGWWTHGSTRTELARGAVQYLMGYLKKSNSKNFGGFPDGCRLYSVGGMDHSMRRARRWLGLPAFVQGNSSYSDDWRRAPGGGWTDPDGVWWPSEFRRIGVAGVYCLQRVHTHPRTIEAAGPFAWLTDRPSDY